MFLMYKDTTIYWLDMTNGPGHGTIAEMVKEYSYHMLPAHHEYNSTTIAFPKGVNVKVKDLTGWTDVSSIVLNERFEWCSITVDNDEILIPEDKLIPIYYDDKCISGFHGETKYPYLLKHPSKMNFDDKIRIIRDCQSEFHVPKMLRIREHNLVSYDIVTESRFINASVFHLYASDNILVRSIKDWNDPDNIKNFK